MDKDCSVKLPVSYWLYCLVESLDALLTCWAVDNNEAEELNPCMAWLIDTTGYCAMFFVGLACFGMGRFLLCTMKKDSDMISAASKIMWVLFAVIFFVFSHDIYEVLR